MTNNNEINKNEELEYDIPELKEFLENRTVLEPEVGKRGLFVIEDIILFAEIAEMSEDTWVIQTGDISLDLEITEEFLDSYLFLDFKENEITVYNKYLDIVRDYENLVNTSEDVPKALENKGQEYLKSVLEAIEFLNVSCNFSFEHQLDKLGLLGLESEFTVKLDNEYFLSINPINFDEYSYPLVNVKFGISNNKENEKLFENLSEEEFKLFETVNFSNTDDNVYIDTNLDLEKNEELLEKLGLPTLKKLQGLINNLEEKRMAVTIKPVAVHVEEHNEYVVFYDMVIVYDIFENFVTFYDNFLVDFLDAVPFESKEEK